MTLYLVGTCHVDPYGPARLRDAIRLVEPSLIGVECTPEGASDRMSKRQTLEGIIKPRYSHPFLEDTGNPETEHDRQLFCNRIAGFEYWVPREMQKEMSFGIEFLMYESISQKAWQYYDKVLKSTGSSMEEFTNDLLNMSREELHEFCSRSYSNANASQICMLQAYDSMMAERARDIIRQAEGNVMMVVGASHAFNQPCMYDKLKDLQPKRFKLTDVDRLCNQVAEGANLDALLSESCPSSQRSFFMATYSLRK